MTAARYSRSGWVWHHASSTQRRAFIALTPLTCASCWEIIPPGSMFTKHATRANRHACLPACWRCQPFDLIAPHKQRRPLRRTA